MSQLGLEYNDEEILGIPPGIRKCQTSCFTRLFTSLTRPVPVHRVGNFNFCSQTKVVTPLTRNAINSLFGYS